NAVSPGPVATPLHGKLGMGEAEIKALEGQIPLGRRGHPREIAEAVLFLASDAGAFAGGSEFIIDGGMAPLLGRDKALPRADGPQRRPAPTKSSFHRD